MFEDRVYDFSNIILSEEQIAQAALTMESVDDTFEYLLSAGKSKSDSFIVSVKRLSTRHVSQDKITKILNQNGFVVISFLTNDVVEICKR